MERLLRRDDDLYRYAEGWAEHRKGDVWEHSWIVDASDRVIDVNREWRGARAYFGVVIPKDVWVTHLQECEECGCEEFSAVVFHAFRLSNLSCTHWAQTGADPVRGLEPGTTTATDVALAYLEEALRCFNAGCHSAATLLLGVATEAVFLRLCDIVAAALKTAADREAFADLPDRVRPRHRWVVEKYQALPGEIRRRELPESLDVTLSGLYELIRRQRNELGHPQDNPPAISREQAFVFFRLLPAYLKDVEAFASYCKTNGL